MLQHGTFSLALLILLSVAPAAAQQPAIGLSSNMIIVQDLDASLAFYRDVLGYRADPRRELSSPLSLEPAGLGRFERVSFARVWPSLKVRNRPEGTGAAPLSLLQPHGLDDNGALPIRSCSEFGSGVGDTVLSHEVVGLDQIRRRLANTPHCIVSDIQPSRTGKSRTLAVLDPNGILLELYEYVDEVK